MQNLDSPKLLIPTSAIDSYDSDSFIVGSKYYPKSQATRTTLTLDQNCIDKIGLKSVIINKDLDTATVEFSAKALREQYPLGINSNTIEQAIENISGQAVRFNTSKLLDTAQVLRADFTENLPISGDIRLYTASLGAYRYLNSKYDFRTYNTKNNESVVITKRSRSKGYTNRLTGYNKPGDNSRACNRDIAQLLSANAFIDKPLRIEQNMKSVTDLKARLDITDTSLDSVLNCKATPLLDTVNDITRVLDKLKGVEYMETSIMQQFESTGDKRWFDNYIRLKGKRALAGEFDNDIQQLELALQAGSHSRKHVWSLKHQLIEAITINRQQEALKQGKTGMIDNEYISELKQGLQQVYSV